jgi:hypothetical protein
MANIFYLKQGDTYPNIETILADANGPVDLTDADVLFRMSVANTGNLMVEKPATVVVPQTGVDMGKVYAEFDPADTAELGEYRVEWRVTFANGKIATFPRGVGSTEFNKIIISQIVD